MASGTFIPFAQYNQDLTRSMSGLCQIYPSRHITVNINCGTKDIESMVAAADVEADKIRNITGTVMEVDYGKIRSALYKAIYPKIAIPDSKTAPGAPAMGEINFISHELQGGWMYNDIYVHVTPEEGKSTIIMQPSGFDVDPKRTGLNFNIETKKYAIEKSERSELTFNAVIIYYNLYRVDPASKTAATEPIVIDMPLGIYVLNQPATVQLNNENIYNQGAAWSTRIVSRIATKDTIASVSADRNQEYATLARVLSEFGDVAETMDKILHRRDVTTRNRTIAGTDSLALSPEDIKSYLEEFRRLSAVNVPYVKDNHWFVNGRDLGPVSGEVDWVSIFNEWLAGLDGSMLEKMRGPEGPAGRNGAPGERGPKGDPGNDGTNGIDGPQGPAGKDGHTPVLTLDADGYLYVDDIKQPYCLKGPAGKDGQDGKDGKDGSKGDTGNPGAPGAAGPQGIQGPTGLTGPQGPKGDPGDDGHTPEITLDADGYLFIDGVRQLPCLKGADGKNGQDGKDANTTDTEYGLKVQVIGGPTNMGTTGYNVFCNGSLSHYNHSSFPVGDTCKTVLETAFKLAASAGANVCSIGGASVGYWIEFKFANATMRLGISSSTQLLGIMEFYGYVGSQFQKTTGRVIIGGTFSNANNITVTSIAMQNTTTENY